MVRTQRLISAARNIHCWWREGALLVLSLVVFAWTASHAPLAQDRSYHDFADQRWLYGVPHFWNVLSNVPFAVIGMIGCSWLIRTGRTSPAFEEPGERAPYFVFFVGELLTCFGSAYYHAHPTNATLVWDRLVFSLMLTSIFTVVVGEFMNRRLGRAMLAPMVAVGLVSVLYWAHTESLGNGDLRLYFLVQFYPMLAIPIILLLFRSRYTHGAAFWLMLALYALAKVAEVNDTLVLQWNGVLSGHTVKHFLAGIASYIPLFCLQRRTRMQTAPWHLATDGVLSRVTYAAMTVWGVGEAIDSIPALIGIFGLGFMVYSSVLWLLAWMIAFVSSIALIAGGQKVHRQRVLIWYGLVGLVLVSWTFGPLKLAAEFGAAVIPTRWFLGQATKGTGVRSQKRFV